MSETYTHRYMKASFLILLLVSACNTTNDTPRRLGSEAGNSYPPIDFIVQDASAYAQPTIDGVIKLKPSKFFFRIKGPSVGEPPFGQIPALIQQIQKAHIEIVYWPDVTTDTFTQFYAFKDFAYPTADPTSLPCKSGVNTCNMCAPIDYLRMINLKLDQKITTIALEHQKSCIDVTNANFQNGTLNAYAAIGEDELSLEINTNAVLPNKSSLKQIVNAQFFSTGSASSGAHASFSAGNLLQMYDFTVEDPNANLPQNFSDGKSAADTIMNYMKSKGWSTQPGNYLMFSYSSDSAQNFSSCDAKCFTAFVNQLRDAHGIKNPIGIWHEQGAFKAWGLPLDHSGAAQDKLLN